MFHFVVAIQCINLSILFAECWIVLRNWKGNLHSYLFLSSVATLINNLGYLLEVSSHTEEACFQALIFSYFGKVWTAYALFLFITEITRTKIPNAVRVILPILSVIVHVSLATTRYTNLFYREIFFSTDGSIARLNHTNGIMHHFWFALLLFYITFGLVCLLKARHREKNKVTRTRFLMVIIAIFIESLFTIIQVLKLFPVTQDYDLTMPGFTLGAVFMLIAIFRYRLLDAEALAREYVIDELSEAIIATNAEGRVIYYNKPAEMIFPELEKDPQDVLSRLRDVIRAGDPLRIGERIYSPEENQLCQGQTVAGTLFSLTDDTEHFNYMARLEEQKQIADNANKAKSSFLANMSHEIRTPINAVLGMDEMILREANEPEILSYAKDIHSAGRTLLSLINDILDFSKIEEGRMEILPTQYELASLINDLVNMIRERAEKKGLKLEVSVDEKIPHLLYGDEVRIKQIALNLLTNAVKYTEAGEVRIEVGFRKESDEKIFLGFRISDTGIGMKEEDMDKLFSPFSRIEEERNRTIEGTGLGMSIVKQLLALMDSHLDVKSVYGEGSSFSFEIRQKVVKWEPVGNDAARLASGSRREEVYRELFHAPDARILVVDDTEVNLNVICNLLKKTQIGIDTALSGKDAVFAAMNRNYDVIFIDHMMPDMDGIETLKRLKSETDPKGTVYVALTANAVSGARERYLNAGFDDYLSKPVDGRHLEEMLKEYLPKEKLLQPDTKVRKNHPAPDLSEGKKILVVDDDEVALETAAEILKDDFAVVGCLDGREAVKLAKEEQPALILLDINLVGITGFEVLSQLKEEPLVGEIPVMFITADEDREKEVLGLKNGALDFVRKPFVPEVLLQRSKRIIALDRFQKDLQGEVIRQTGRAERLTREMMAALSHTVDAKDHYTNGHSARVAAYAAEIGRRLGKSLAEQNKLYEIGLLHDIGKIGIPEEIINKTERLTDEEFGRIKEHTVIGNEILKGISDLPELALGARSHHERYGGGGYPDGLMGEEIPEVARIICVADCYDAMTSTRTYSKPKEQSAVRKEIERCSGIQFDPRIAAVMLAMIDDDTEYLMNERHDSRSVWKGSDYFWSSAEEKPDEAAAEAEPDAEEVEIPQWLMEIPELDVSKGIGNCGSKEGFLSVLKTFYKTAGTKAGEIEDLYRKQDLENYTIKVHALKSSARIIGAEVLSEMAKDLELAGKAKDTDKIQAQTEDLLKAYRALNEHLSPLEKDHSPKKEFNGKMRKEAFQTIEEIALGMDYGMLEGVLKELKNYGLSDADEKTVQAVEDAFLRLDWDSILRIVRDAY